MLCEAVVVDVDGEVVGTAAAAHVGGVDVGAVGLAGAKRAPVTVRVSGSTPEGRSPTVVRRV